jgi:hypothetical protein
MLDVNHYYCVIYQRPKNGSQRGATIDERMATGPGWNADGSPLVSETASTGPPSAHPHFLHGVVHFEEGMPPMTWLVTVPPLTLAILGSLAWLEQKMAAIEA